MGRQNELISRAEAGRILGISRVTLRRYEERGLVKPGIDARGVHWFERGSVERLARKRRSVARSATVTIDGTIGEELARVLGLRWPCAPRALVAAAEQLRQAAGRAKVPPAQAPHAA